MSVDDEKTAQAIEAIRSAFEDAFENPEHQAEIEYGDNVLYGWRCQVCAAVFLCGMEANNPSGDSPCCPMCEVHLTEPHMVAGCYGLLGMVGE
jgi:rubrerythrin